MATTKSAPTIEKFGLQTGTERTIFATWKWSKSHTKEYKCIWYYATGDGVWFIGADTTETVKQSTYTAPENATKVKFKVKAIAKTHKVNKKDVAYWTGKFSSEKKYNFKSSPPSKPSAPEIGINEYNKTQIDLSISNLDSKWTATGVEFEVYKDGTSNPFYTGYSTIQNQSAGISCTIETGYKYKARCRGYTMDDEGEWSDYSSTVTTQPSSPGKITTLRALSSTSITMDWDRVANCTSYEIQYTTERQYFDANPDQVTSKTIESEAGHAEFTGLESGKEYFFRVRAVNSAGNSGWSDEASVVIGKEPSAPTTWSSTTTAMVGESLILYWIHNSQDGSYEKHAQLELNVDGRITTQTIQNTKSDDDQGKASTYSINTGVYTEGTTIKWRVRTSGITEAYSEWSATREVNIYAHPTLSVYVRKMDGTALSTLTSFPFYINAIPGPKTQSPIGYYVDITANEGYETTDQVGNEYMVAAGESVYSKYFNASGNLAIGISANDLDLENSISYTVKVTVTMNIGLSCDATTKFTVSWDETVDEPNAEIAYDPDTYSCIIRPYCEDENEKLAANVRLAVYRKEYTGEFVEIASGIENTHGHYVTDPHPALDYARYRIVATDIKTGAVSYYDPPGYPIGEDGVIIQWSEAWSSFDSSLANEADEVAIPPWTGSLVRLPYNVDVSDKNDKDVALVKYVGRKRPVSYYGTQLGETSSWKMEVPSNDEETLYALRRLAVWMGDVYAREPSGTGYWAHIKVSISQTHCALTIPVSIELTRVEGGA